MQSITVFPSLFLSKSILIQLTVGGLYFVLLLHLIIYLILNPYLQSFLPNVGAEGEFLLVCWLAFSNTLLVVHHTSSLQHLQDILKM